MSAPPEIFDRAAIKAHRARAAAEPALFLHDAAAEMIEERLKEVNRSFTDPVVVTPFAGPWSRFGPVIGDGETLDLAVAAHDLVIHGLCLHLSNDPVGQLIQCRRALRPDGLLLAVLFGGQTLSELRAALAEAEAEVTGGLSPRVAPMGEIRDLGALIGRAGLALPVADSVSVPVEYGSFTRLCHDLRAMGETNPLTQRLRRPTRRSLFDRAEALYPRNPAGRLPATFEIVTLTGWSPSADQPRPLRPGSAAARLADALGVAERNPEKAPE